MSGFYTDSKVSLGERQGGPLVGHGFWGPLRLHWTRVYPRGTAGITSPVQQWREKGVCVTHHPGIYTGRTISRAPVLDGLVARVLGITRLFFMGAAYGFESTPSHILTKVCILGYQGIPQPSRAMNGQRRVCPVPYWTGQ